MTTEEAPLVPADTKDWTWVLERPCPECGFDPANVEVGDVGEALRANATGWAAALVAPQARRRPEPTVWSPTEYAAHVRDVHRVFAERLALMLADDEPRFANWDQDATAVAERYDRATPEEVLPALVVAAEQVATAYDAVRPEQRSRRGVRSNGSEFTVETLARYHLHDVVHHLHDVAAVATVGAYERDAADYATAAPALDGEVLAAIDAFAVRLGPGARVLEIGSAHGRDAAALEERGVVVRRTDVTTAFVRALQAAGHEAEQLDPLTASDAELGRGAPYDGVWANACLLHVARGDLPVVLSRLRGVTRDDGVLRFSVKHGRGERWSTHGSITAPRRFVLWEPTPLVEVTEAAGWVVEDVTVSAGRREETWIAITARGA